MRKILPLLVVSLLASAPAHAALAKPAKPVAASAKQIVDLSPWLYKGSDIPPDTSWTFGELSNGLRYAVKKNGVPPGQMSIRIRVDAGALHENDNELGFAHLMEHLSMRGSTYVPDGESKRIWQRFGVTFGSDSNATTTPTQTVYKLDLPDFTGASLDESMKILSGMMRAPNISDSALTAERGIVQAELRETSDPIMVYQDALRETFFKGQRLEKRQIIGTVASLDAATAEGLQAFHKRWYRPEKTVLVMAGDAEPAEMAALLQKHFGSWTATGIAGVQPDFGKPVKGGVAQLVQEPTFPSQISLGYVRPWVQVNDTIANNQQAMIEGLAIQILDRRFREQARAGGSYLAADVGEEAFMRSGDLTQISVTPAEDRWEDALRDVRAVIADAVASPPSQADINREYTRMMEVLRNRVENASYEQATTAADSIVNAVDIRETVATAEFVLQVAEAIKPKLTPQAVLQATKKLFSEDAPRLVLSSPKPVTDASSRMMAALTGSVIPNANARLAANDLGFDALPALGTPGIVVKSETNPDLQMTRMELSNGVRAVLMPNKNQPDRVDVVVRFGKGVQAIAPGSKDFLWAGPLVLNESGIGDLKQAQIEQMTLGRKIGLVLGIDNDAFEYSAVTRPADLADQLRVIAVKMENPGWDPAPVARARDLERQGYDSYEMSAMAVLERDMSWLLASKDNRFKAPDQTDIANLTPESFRTFWEPLLNQGPVEVLIFGDFDKAAAQAALQSTLGAIRPRTPAAASPAAQTRTFPAPTAIPLRLTHRGPQDQVAAVLAWPAGGGISKVGEGRAMDVLSAIFSDRLFEKFRAEQAASYSADSVSSWPVDFASGGYIAAYSLVRPGEAERFFAFADEVAKDLADNPVTEDELARAVRPKVELIRRNMTSNGYWLMQLKGVSWEPRKFVAFSTLESDYESITPASMQALAKKYLVPGKAWKLVVEPAGKAEAQR